MSIYWELPWVPWVPWDSHGNGNRQASVMGMEMGMVGNKNSTFFAHKQLIIRNC